MRRTLLTLLVTLALPAGASAATPWVGFQPASGTEPAAGFGPFEAGTAVKFAVDSSGASVATWLGTGARVIAARRPPAGAWSAPQVVSTAGATAGTGFDVAMDNAGDATIVWSTTDGTVSATTSLAGAPFSGQQPVTSGLSGFSSAIVDVAMNASGQAVAAFVAGDSAHPVFVSSATTPGGAWATATTISGAASGRSPAVAINAAGAAVATYLEVPSSGTIYKAMGSVKPAGGTFPSSADLVLTAVDLNTPPYPVIDKDGVIQVLVRTQNQPDMPTDRYSVFVIRRSPANNFFYGPDPSGNDRPGKTCLFDSQSQPVSQLGGQLTVDSTGAVTAVFLCNSNLETITRPAGQLFSGQPAIVAADIGGAVPHTFAGTPDGHQLVVTTAGGGVVRAYRRASAAVPFSAGEAIVDPDTPLSVVTVGLDDHADAVALTSKSNGMSAFDLSTTILDVTPGTATVAGPDTGVAGTPLTYTFTGTDAFGGLVGTPSWTTSPDGGTGTGATFTHTFAAPGTYQVAAGQKDLGGANAGATKSVVVTAPAATVTPGPTVTPTVSSVPSTTPTVSPTASPTPAPAAAKCVVPKLTGKTVAKARKALKKAHCKLGKVKKPRHHGKKIKTQTVKQGTQLPAGAKVKVALKKKH